MLASITDTRTTFFPSNSPLSLSMFTFPKASHIGVEPPRSRFRGGTWRPHRNAGVLYGGCEEALAVLCCMEHPLVPGVAGSMESTVLLPSENRSPRHDLFGRGVDEAGEPSRRADSMSPREYLPYEVEARRVRRRSPWPQTYDPLSPPGASGVDCIVVCIYLPGCHIYLRSPESWSSRSVIHALCLA